MIVGVVVSPSSILMQNRASGSAAITPAPVGSQMTMFGDGVMAANGAIGARCASFWALAALNGRVLPSPGFMQAKSGGDMDTIYARISYAIAQKADIPVFTSQGHNDGLMTTDPDSDATYINKWIRNLDAWVVGNPLRSAGGMAYFIPVCSTLPSNAGTETPTIRTKVWTRQQAAVAAYGNAAIYYVATGESINVATMYEAGDTAHPNNLGGYTAGFLTLGPAISTNVVAASQAAILALLAGNTYPGLTAANVDQNNGLTLTTGSKSGTVTPTGNVAATKSVTNNLINGTSVAVAVDNAAGVGPQQTVTITGTPSVENTVIFSGTNTTITGATPGGYTVGAMRVLFDDGAGGAAAGLNTFGLDVGGGNYGVFMTSGAVSNTGAPVPAAVDAVIIIPPLALGFASTFSQSTRAVPRRGVVSGTARMIVESPSIRVASTRTRQAPANYSDNTIVPSLNSTRLTGTLVSGAGTLRADPGSWVPYGLLAADFTFRIYKGGSATIGTGSLLTTFSGPTWTWVTSGVAAADNLYLEVDCSNGVGGTVTYRTPTAYVAA